MATLESSIKMTDRLSRPVGFMANAVSKLIQKMEIANKQNISPKDLGSIKDELIKSGVEIKNLQKDIQGITNPIQNNIGNQKEWNNAINNGKNSMGGLVDKLKAAALAYGGIQGAKNLMNMSDKVMQIDARLNLITSNEGQKNALKDYIYKQAQESKTPLNDLSDQVAKVGLLAGDKFKGGNREIVDYVTTLSKAFKVSGADAQGASAAMYQLNQALVSGKLQGDEFRSVMENAPMLAQAIAKQMGVGVSELKKLGAEGKITSNIIRESVIGMTADVNDKFATIPMTWGDMWVKVKNFGIKSMNPLLLKINEVVNNPKVIKFGMEFNEVFKSILLVGSKTFDVISSGLGFLYDKWKILKYPIIGLISILTAYMAIQSITNGIIAFNTFIEGLRAAALYVSEGATFAATVAQYGLNAAIYAFPGTWIILIIAGIIGMILLFTKHILGASSVAGTLAGAWAGTKALLYNIWVGLVNTWYATKEAIINILNSLISLSARGLSNYANIYIDVFNYILKHGTDFMNGLLGILSKANPLLNKIGINIPEKIGEAFQLKKIDIKAKEIENDTKGKRLIYKDIAYEAKEGAKKGDNWWNNKETDFGVRTDYNDMFDLGGKYDSNTSKDIGDTSKNTKKMADKLEDTEEDLKYLRELAEQEHINQFTTAEIKVDMQNNNQITQVSDFDDLLRKFSEKLETTLKTTANGVYY